MVGVLPTVGAVGAASDEAGCNAFGGLHVRLVSYSLHSDRLTDSQSPSKPNKHCDHSGSRFLISGGTASTGKNRLVAFRSAINYQRMWNARCAPLIYHIVWISA